MGIITFTYTVVDGKTPPKKSEITLYAQDTGLLTTGNLAEVARDHLPVIRALITGGIVDCKIGFHPDMSAVFTGDPTIKIPDPDSDVEEGVTFVFRPLDGDIRPTLLRIPSFSEDFILEGTRLVDVAATEVALFVDSINDGTFPYSFDFDFSNSRGEDLAVLQGAEENFKRRKYKRK